MLKFSRQVFAAVALTAVASAAQAYVQISLVDTGGGAVSCSTQNAATVAACSAGFTAFGGGAVTVGTLDLQFSGFVGGFRVTTTSLGSNTPGTMVVGTLDQSATRVERRTGFGAGTLFIDSFAFNYTSPVGPLRSFTGATSFDSSLYANTDSVTTVLTYDPFNLGGDNFSAGTTSFAATLSLPPYDGSSKSDSEAFGLVTVAGPGSYSLRHKQAYALAEGSVINSTATSAVRRIPEPMSASLVGIALLGLAFAARRKA